MSGTRTNKVLRWRRRTPPSWATPASKEIDFAIAEDYQVHDECGRCSEAFQKSCSDRGGKASVIHRDRNVVPYYVYEACPRA